MAWLPYVAPEGETVQQRTALDEVRAERGAVSLFSRTLAHSPAGLRTYEDLSRHVRLASPLAPALRELVILRIAQHFGNEYEWRRHTRAALALGIAQERLAALAGWRDAGDAFDARERAALGWVDGFLGGDHRPPPAAMEALTAAFTPEEVVELALLAGLYVTVAAVMVPLGLSEDDEAAPAPLPMTLVSDI